VHQILHRKTPVVRLSGQDNHAEASREFRQQFLIAVENAKFIHRCDISGGVTVIFGTTGAFLLEQAAY
jgi:hypothetical protein